MCHDSSDFSYDSSGLQIMKLCKRNGLCVIAVKHETAIDAKTGEFNAAMKCVGGEGLCLMP